MGRPKKKAVKRPQATYQWLARNACWSMDTMRVRFMGGWLYVMLVLEEYSRLILGYRIAPHIIGQYARELLAATILELGIRPLVVKHDRGSEFVNGTFQGLLRTEQIVSLPSPGYYAPFNSRIERGIRVMRKFTWALERRYDAELEEVDHAIGRGRYIINEEMPRRIFKGVTGRRIYEEGVDYDPGDRDRLIDEIFAYQRMLDGEFFLKGEELDMQRKEVVRYLQQVSLCEVGFTYRHSSVVEQAPSSEELGGLLRGERSTEVPLHSMPSPQGRNSSGILGSVRAYGQPVSSSIRPKR